MVFLYQVALFSIFFLLSHNFHFILARFSPITEELCSSSLVCRIYDITGTSHK